MNTIKLNHDQLVLLLDTLEDIIYHKGHLDVDLMEYLDTPACHDLHKDICDSAETVR